jgi:hypothetical protein
MSKRKIIRAKKSPAKNTKTDPGYAFSCIKDTKDLDAFYKRQEIIDNLLADATKAAS